MEIGKKIILNNLLVTYKNNFNFIRIICAFLVFYEHAFPIFTGKLAQHDICRVLFSYSSGSVGISVFFCISGYLVSRSFSSSNNLIHYFVKRLLRIVPALVVLTLLSIIGLSFLSSLHFKDYYLHDLSFLYLQNGLIFRTYYSLPGVFEFNIYGNSVNGSLWSIPYEFFCYMLIPLIFKINLKRLKITYLFVSISLLVIYHYNMTNLGGFVVPFLGITLQSLFLPFLYFNAGINYFLFKDKLKFNRYELALSFLILFLVSIEILPRIVNLASIAYFTFFLSKMQGRVFSLFQKIPDVSYGFYLYAFPIQQTFSYFFYGEWSLITLFSFSLIITLLFAYLSWIFIEKPFLKLKNRFENKKILPN